MGGRMMIKKMGVIMMIKAKKSSNRAEDQQSK